MINQIAQPKWTLFFGISIAIQSSGPKVKDYLQAVSSGRDSFKNRDSSPWGGIFHLGKIPSCATEG
jgi:hypothetical protein